MSKKNLLCGLLIILFASMFSVSLVSCGDEDDDNPNESTITENDPEGTIIANLTNTFYASGNGYYKEGLEYMNGMHHNYLGMNSSNNIVAQSANYVAYIVSVGKVKSLSDIRTIPESGWSHEVAAVPGCGYIYKSSYKEGGIIYWRYARIYVVDYVTNTSGGIMGITIKYQEEWEPNSK